MQPQHYGVQVIPGERSTSKSVPVESNYAGRVAMQHEQSYGIRVTNWDSCHSFVRLWIDGECVASYIQRPMSRMVLYAPVLDSSKVCFAFYKPLHADFVLIKTVFAPALGLSNYLEESFMSIEGVECDRTQEAEIYLRLVHDELSE